MRLLVLAALAVAALALVPSSDADDGRVERPRGATCGSDPSVVCVTTGREVGAGEAIGCGLLRLACGVFPSGSP